MPKRTRSTTLSQADMAITARQAQMGLRIPGRTDDQDGGDLADDRQPAQAQKRVEAHAAPPLMMLLERDFRMALFYMIFLDA